MFDPTIFYSSYLDDYHKFKAITIKSILDNLDSQTNIFFGEDLSPENKEAYKKTMQADLRQTYFHAIETFFELFLCLNPLNKKFMGDKNVMIALTQSNWRESYDQIKQIATDEKALDYLDNEVTMHKTKVTVGHYIFYYGIADIQKFDGQFSEKLSLSLDAIKYGIRLIAKDFIDREEYNCYKHGLRIIPARKELSIVDMATMKPHIKWDLDDSMSFFLKTKMTDEVKIVTKVFDPDRDFQMTYFCSNLISNMVYYRKMSFDNKKDPKSQFALAFFGKDKVSECNKINVELQNMVYTVTKVTK
jgi:hypothetical protein